MTCRNCGEEHPPDRAEDLDFCIGRLQEKFLRAKTLYEDSWRRQNEVITDLYRDYQRLRDALVDIANNCDMDRPVALAALRKPECKSES